MTATMQTKSATPPSQPGSCGSGSVPTSSALSPMTF